MSPARKLTADAYPAIIKNAYFKPSYKTPYYTVRLNTKSGSMIDTIIDPCNTDEDTSVGYYLDIKCGNDSKYIPNQAHVEYLKTPNKVFITEDQLYGVDNTEQMEFSDYVCYEIINEFVKLLLENTADPRLSTNVPINQTVTPPMTSQDV